MLLSSTNSGSIEMDLTVAIHIIRYTVYQIDNCKELNELEVKEQELGKWQPVIRGSSDIVEPYDLASNT